MQDEAIVNVECLKTCKESIELLAI